jgi:ubiquitin carboxyl-terminal hydrolase 14
MLVTVKWGKEQYTVDLDPSGDVVTFKATLQSLTGVSVDRQKLMSKVWKGVLKDEVVWATLPDLKEGAVIMLMGSADTVVQPSSATVFVEDMPKGAAALLGRAIPVGCENLGNTCYANSTIEALRFIPELKDAIVAFRTRAR